MDNGSLPGHHARVDLCWVDDTLAIAARPRGNEWLAAELQALRRAEVHTLVSCLTADEERDLGLCDEETLAGRYGLGFVHIPIPDRGLPPSLADFVSAVDRLAGVRAAGHKVAVHCRQGLGRAPLVAAALLTMTGVPPGDAWRSIGQRRGTRVPETAAQEQWLEAYPARRAALAYLGEK